MVIGRESTCRNGAVNVGMQKQVLSPSMQDADHADLGAPPTITSAPLGVTYGGTFTVLTPKTDMRPWFSSSPGQSRIHLIWTGGSLACRSRRLRAGSRRPFPAIRTSRHQATTCSSSLTKPEYLRLPALCT